MTPNADQTGKLVGFADSGTVTASFSSDNASTAEMMTEKTYTRAGWEFVGEAAIKHRKHLDNLRGYELSPAELGKIV